MAPSVGRPSGPAEPWKGVSLGGWMLLEPGPSDPLFSRHPDPATGLEARCEWELMQILHEKLGEKGAQETIESHRQTHITKRDFERIRGCAGLNSVRLPVGYWVVLGPNPGEPYTGPGLHHIDRAVAWAEECGLQVMLDLHGCPGGESGEAPCGRRQRPDGTWKWQHWNMDQSLKALEVLCQRYRSRACVNGIAVCNEPSNLTPLTRLCQYYGRAIDTVRRCGMPASRVAVVLPVFQRPEDKFAKKWRAMFGDRHKNYCFDVHCYHCFENEFNGKTLAQHLRAVEANAKMLQQYPMVVGEWSLSLGQAAWSTCAEMSELDVYATFGRAQLRAFQEASHGHFFWNWTERAETLEWNYQMAQSLLVGPAPTVPQWDGRGEDPLEEVFNPAPSLSRTGTADARIFTGDKVALRVFYGRYVDVEGPRVQGRFCDKGSWQSLVFQRTTGSGRREIKHGDVVLLRAHNGRYLTVDREGKVHASKAVGRSSRFTVHLGNGAEVLKHRGAMFLESKFRAAMLDADDTEEGIFARFPDMGDWQTFCAEKVPLKRARETPLPAAAAGEAGQVAAEAAKEAVPPPTPKNRRKLVCKSPESTEPIAAKRRRLGDRSTSSSSLASLSTKAPSRSFSLQSLPLSSSSASSARSILL